MRGNPIANTICSKILEAIDLRTTLIRPEDNSGRLINSNGDNLPGLIVDLYDDYLVVEITNLAMKSIQDKVIDILSETLSPKGILIKHRKNAKEIVETISGKSLPEITITSNDALYLTNPTKGTIHFFDQNDNRAWFSHLMKGYTVLDTFCYSGAWGIESALAGAKSVTFIDSDKKAIKLTEHNWQLNNLGDNIETHVKTTLNYLNECIDSDKKFDAIVVDPPISIKQRDEIEELNDKAIQVLHKGGLLVTSCPVPSITFESFSKIIAKAATNADKFCKVIHIGHLSSCFPVDAMFPESSYLKCIFGRVY